MTREERAEHLRAIRRFNEKTAELLEKQGHPDENVRVVRELHEVERRRRGHTPLGPLEWALKEKVLTKKNLLVLLPIALRGAEKGHDPENLFQALRRGRESRAFRKILPTHLVPHLEEMADRGHDPGDLAGVVGAGLKTEAFTARRIGKSIAFLRTILEESKREGHDPHELSHVLQTALHNKFPLEELRKMAPALNAVITRARTAGSPELGRFVYLLGHAMGRRSVKNAEDMKALCALLEAEIRAYPRANLEGLIEHTFDAHDEIGDFHETLRLQHELLKRGMLPTKYLTVRLWKAPPER